DSHALGIKSQVEGDLRLVRDRTTGGNGSPARLSVELRDQNLAVVNVQNTVQILYADRCAGGDQRHLLQPNLAAYSWSCPAARPAHVKCERACRLQIGVEDGEQFQVD